MTLKDRFAYLVANNLYWSHLWLVWAQTLSGAFN